MSVISLLRLDAALRAAGIPIDGVGGVQGAVRVDYQPSATAAQIAQGVAIVAAFDWSAPPDATFLAQRAKSAAASMVSGGSLQAAGPTDRALVSLVLLILNEFNLHSTFEANLLTAIATATSLASLQTLAAALTRVPQRTTAQLISALTTNITNTAE